MLAAWFFFFFNLDIFKIFYLGIFLLFIWIFFIVGFLKKKLLWL